MAVDELHANIGLRGAASRFCRQSVVASRVWAGSFTAMAEGGEGEDEIQFLRTVSKHYSASASLSPINAFRGRHAVQPINPSSRPPPIKKWLMVGGKFGGAEMSIPAFLFSPLFFACARAVFGWKLPLVCAAHLSTGLLMCGISMRLSPAAGARAAMTPHRLPLLLLHPPPPLSVYYLSSRVCLPGVDVWTVLPGERSFSKLRSHVSPPLGLRWLF